MFAAALPCNPKPFAFALAEYFDSTSIKSDDAKQILWVLMAQAYGELADISLYEEYKRLVAPNPKMAEVWARKYFNLEFGEGNWIFYIEPGKESLKVAVRGMGGCRSLTLI